MIFTDFYHKVHEEHKANPPLPPFKKGGVDGGFTKGEYKISTSAIFSQSEIGTTKGGGI